VRHAKWGEGTIRRVAGVEAVVDLPLAGTYQRDNLQLALALARCTVAAEWVGELEMERVIRALEAVRWPGRLSTHEIAGREVLLDCAHNLEAARALADHLDREGCRYNLVFSCLDDKPVEEMAALLRPRVDRVAICRLEDERAMAIDRLVAAFPDAVVADDPLACLEELPDPVLGAGSIRVVGSLLAAEG
jgi:folylpolyglutamate synthase/dihydropteroate synthase